MSELQPRPLPADSEYIASREDLERNIEDFQRDHRCGYHFWLSSEVPYLHLEDQRARSVFRCSICNHEVWREPTEFSDCHWFWCECLTASFPPTAAVPTTTEQWASLILALKGNPKEPAET
jgi:hypothetical protein